MEAIQDIAVYAKEADGYSPKLYYLMVWIGYLKKENTWEPSSTVIHLQKMINIFHKDHSEKSTITSASLNFFPSMTKSIIKLLINWKRECPTKSTKCVKLGDKEDI